MINKKGDGVNAPVILGVVGAPAVKPKIMLKLQYKDLLNSVASFLSLDISVRGTGWAMWKDGELTYGRYTLQAKDEVGRVVEFTDWLEKLIDGYAFDYFFVEDVIQSNNFKTVRSLIALNSQLELMIRKGTVAKPKEFFKCGNNVWKKNLKGLAGSDLVMRGVDYLNGNDKERTKACLESLGLSVDALKGGKYNDKQVEDICDAIGMALGTIGVEINKIACLAGTKVQNTDIRKGYNIKQFTNEEEAMKSAKRCSKKGTIEVITHDITESTLDLVQFMKKQLAEKPDALYVVHAPVSKCCNVLLLKKLDASLDDYYFTIIRR